MSEDWVAWLAERYARGIIEIERFEELVEKALEGEKPEGYFHMRGITAQPGAIYEFPNPASLGNSNAILKDIYVRE